MPNQKHTNMKTAWLAGFLFLSNQCVSGQRTHDVPGQLHESVKASSPNEKPFSPTVVKPHARKLAKASRRSCERPGKNERTFEQPPYLFTSSEELYLYTSGQWDSRSTNDRMPVTPKLISQRPHRRVSPHTVLDGRVHVYGARPWAV